MPIIYSLIIVAVASMLPGIYRLIEDHRNSESAWKTKTFWIVNFLLMPIVGIFFFYIFGPLPYDLSQGFPAEELEKLKDLKFMSFYYGVSAPMLLRTLVSKPTIDVNSLIDRNRID